MKKDCSGLLQRFETYLQGQPLFASCRKILIACSGGPDSVALFHLLRILAPHRKWKIALIHFNHELRPREAKKDENFVCRLAEKFRVPFYVGAGNVKREARKTQTSIEECARKMRYDFFIRTARREKFPVIVLAHTQDDQAETVLMRVIQGTGLRGLQGIREKVKVGKVALVRPLLHFAKQELLEFLRKEKRRFCRDKTNDSTQFVRNRIRLELIPSLRRDFNPCVTEAVLFFSNFLRRFNSEWWKKPSNGWIPEAGFLLKLGNGFGEGLPGLDSAARFPEISILR
jgi:tRNA(Ile)-lysidine synthase